MEKTVNIYLDGELIDSFIFDAGDDMTETEVYESVAEYVLSYIDIEVE